MQGASLTTGKTNSTARSPVTRQTAPVLLQYTPDFVVTCTPVVSLTKEADPDMSFSLASRANQQRRSIFSFPRTPAAVIFVPDSCFQWKKTVEKLRHSPGEESRLDYESLEVVVEERESAYGQQDGSIVDGEVGDVLLHEEVKRKQLVRRMMQVEVKDGCKEMQTSTQGQRPFAHLRKQRKRQSENKCPQPHSEKPRLAS